MFEKLKGMFCSIIGNIIHCFSNKLTERVIAGVVSSGIVAGAVYRFRARVIPLLFLKVPLYFMLLEALFIALAAAAIAIIRKRTVNPRFSLFNVGDTVEYKNYGDRVITYTVIDKTHSKVISIMTARSGKKPLMPCSR